MHFDRRSLGLALGSRAALAGRGAVLAPGPRLHRAASPGEKGTRVPVKTGPISGPIFFRDGTQFLRTHFR